MKLKDGQKALIIGDIHGCYDEMIELIKRSGVCIGTDIIITVGDVLDRGYKAYEAIRFFADTDNVFMVLGNHEIKHLKRNIFSKDDPSGNIQRLMLKDDQYDFIMNFIKSLPLYMELEINADKYLIIHAGITNDIDISKIPKHISNYDKIDNKVKLILGIGSQGREGFNEKSTPWYETIDIDSIVVYGHKINDDIVYGSRKNVIGLDTGSYEGKKLSGIMLPDYKVISVEIKANYYAEIISEYLDRVYILNYEHLSWKDKEELIHKTRSRDLISMIEKDFSILDRIHNYILRISESLKTKYGELSPEQKRELGMNWDKKHKFHKVLSADIKKAFFSRLKREDLYKYDIRELKIMDIDL